MKVRLERKGRCPEIEFDTDGITVLLGANGAGKTGVLNALKELGAASLGGRTIFPVSTLRIGYYLNQIPLEEARGAETFEARVTREEAGIGSRANAVFDRLWRQDQKQSESDIARWQQWKYDGCVGQPPEVTPESGLLELLARAGSHVGIRYRVNSKDRALFCRLGDVEYPAKHMCDGESQELLLTALLSAAPVNSIVTVDEPEIGFHPLLADQFWTDMERARPDLSWVYATHSISFAARRNVSRVLVIDRWKKVAREVRSVHSSELDEATRRELLGALPGLLRCQHALLVEGRADSLDRTFYAWLLHPAAVAIVPAHGSTTVLASARRTVNLGDERLGARVVAVVDLDGKPAADVGDDGPVRTPYRHLESMLCEPDLVVRAAREVGAPSLTSVQEVVGLLADLFGSDLERVALERAESRLAFQFRPSVPRSTFGTRPARSALSAALMEATDRQADESARRRESAPTVLAEEIARCESAVQTLKDGAPRIALQIFPAKNALRSIVERLGLSSAFDYLDVVCRLPVRDFPTLVHFRAEILKRFGIADDTGGSVL